MEILLIIVLGGVLVWWGYTHMNKDRTDGSHPLDSVSKQPEAPYKVETPAPTPEPAPQPVAASNPLDVNNDGKVNLEDVKEAVKKTKTRAKKAVAEVKEEVKKTTGRKPRSKA